MLNSLLPPIEHDEFQLWLQHPVTRRLQLFLADQIAAAKEEWINGVFVSDTEFSTLRNYFMALGKAQGFEDLLNLTEEDLNGTDEQQGQ